MLKLIQLGISLVDEEGNWVDGCTCWQFNFKFSLSYVATLARRLRDVLLMD